MGQDLGLFMCQLTPLAVQFEKTLMRGCHRRLLTGAAPITTTTTTKLSIFRDGEVDARYHKAAIATLQQSLLLL
jgi:hypothetical protein